MNQLEVRRAAFAKDEEAIRFIRLAVFVEEQGVPRELEMDDRDSEAIHMLASWDGLPVGTGRLLPGGHIGRVAVLPEFRGRGIGKAIMQRLIGEAAKRGLASVALASQIHAVPFYERLGFARESASYLEAGIEHVDMRLRL